MKPAAKRSKQTAMTDFLKAPQARKISKSMKPASPPKKKRATKLDEDDDEGPRRPGRSRSAAVKEYVEIDSDEGGDDSLFVDDE